MIIADQSSSSEKCQLLASQIAWHKWSSACTADRSAQKHFAHMLQNSDPEYWNLFVNILLWFKQCICLWKQLVFYCYIDFSVEKENNLWLMLAVVSCAASCVLKKPFILWYVFVHSAGKEKARRLASICVRQDFSLDVALSLWSEKPPCVWDQREGWGRIPGRRQGICAQSLSFRNDLSLEQPKYWRLVSNPIISLLLHQLCLLRGVSNPLPIPVFSIPSSRTWPVAVLGAPWGGCPLPWKTG